MLEAEFFPGVIFYLILWYTRKDQAVRMAIFFLGAILACAFGGILLSIAYQSSLKGWQWIFIIEGVPTVCLAFVAFKFLAITWLDQIHKDMLTERLRGDLKMIGDVDDRYTFHEIRLSILD